MNLVFLSDPYTTIDDGQLRSTIRDIRTQFTEIGESIMWGHLRAMGFHVQRERVRRALREIDPLNTALRWRGILTSRRPYCVPGPNSLWHIGMHYCIYFYVYMCTCGNIHDCMSLFSTIRVNGKACEYHY